MTVTTGEMYFLFLYINEDRSGYRCLTLLLRYRYFEGDYVKVTLKMHRENFNIYIFLLLKM